MLVNTSYNEKKVKEAINDLVGKPFGFFENIKLKGIGSPRLDILKTSHEIDLLLSYDNNRNFCNIELRPKGIIIRFRSLLETYSLVIPFYKLVVFKPGNTYTFHIDNHFITIDYPQSKKDIVAFINKINRLKIENSPQYIDDLY
ncbi:hypothetical protein [Flavobacterium sp.]|uniref:hypothetical protein n=1 Tax=Flavobacterium sp. TaxID=239 RepID=UPI00260B29EF|nr:hypothetical protein [Flavobacterium sp.]MDD2985944.1 hypothetical protein [Flavobacterium sp.]